MSDGSHNNKVVPMNSDKSSNSGVPEEQKRKLGVSMVCSAVGEQ